MDRCYLKVIVHIIYLHKTVILPIYVMRLKLEEVNLIDFILMIKKYFAIFSKSA